MTSKTKWLPLFATNFLGVFNHAFFKMMVCLVGVGWVANSKESASNVVSLASGLYVISYIFFSPLAGRLAKTMLKKRIIVVCRMFELALYIIGSLGFYFNNIYIVMGTILSLGFISTLFSPSKYGLIRDVGGKEGVSFGTGALEMFTFMGVTIGPLIAFIVADNYSIYTTSAVLILVGIFAFISIYKLKVIESEPLKNLNDTINPTKFLVQSFKWANTMKGMNAVVIGLGIFWMVGSLIQMTLIVHCPVALNMTKNTTNLVFTSTVLGIGIGSYITGILSKGKVELGYTPLGAIGMLICLLLIYITNPTGTTFGILTFLTAFFCGIYMVPLSAYIQNQVEGRRQSEMLAYSNFTCFLLIFVSTAMFGLISKYLGTIYIFLLMAIVVLTMTIFMLIKVPEMTNRFKKLIIR